MALSFGPRRTDRHSPAQAQLPCVSVSQTNGPGGPERSKITIHRQQWTFEQRGGEQRWPKRKFVGCVMPGNLPPSILLSPVWIMCPFRPFAWIKPHKSISNLPFISIRRLWVTIRRCIRFGHNNTEMRFVLCTWFGEFCSCCSLTALPGPTRVLINWISQEFISSLYV